MILSNNGENFIKKIEVLNLVPNWDSVGKFWQIGYSMTHYPNGKPVTELDNPLTQEQADNYFDSRIQDFVDKINSELTTGLLQCQFDTLIIFAYNIGLTAFDDSTLLQDINKNPNDFDTIHTQLLRWVYSNGQFCQGLKNRRESEFIIYSTGEYVIL